MTQDDNNNLTYPLSVIVLCHSFVYPVEDIETPISTAGRNAASASKQRRSDQAAKYLPKKQDVIACKIINILRPLQQHQLRQDGYGLQVEGECPQDLQ